MDFTITSFGRAAVLVTWVSGEADAVIREVHNLFYALREQEYPPVLDIVPAYNSIAVFYRPEMAKQNDVIRWVQEVAMTSSGLMIDTRAKCWEIPVTYASAADSDMLSLQRLTGLAHHEIVRLHAENTYLVAFTGFLPGFPYLLGLADALAVPRKEIYDRKIKAGSVAIGGRQTGIYPCDSPGGWYVIGHTEFTLFQTAETPYCTLSPGDTVRFVPQ
jgi:KipI family sensor histidine kinase inhibitor